MRAACATAAAEAVPAEVARLGSTVTYTELPSGTRRSVRVVTPPNADANEGRVSVPSPIGCALLGHGVDAVVDVHLPAGASMHVRVDEAEHAVVLSA